jgi:8-amino-7-oxononanoate synthase
MQGLDPLSFIDEELKRLHQVHLHRQLRVVEDVLPGGWIAVDGRRLLNLSSNNYLGLANSELLREEAAQCLQHFGTSSSASRLIVGTLSLHQAVEENIAAFHTTEAAILYNTGYMANVGVLSALMSKGDLILSDKLNHASIIDGIMLSGANFKRYPHGDLNRLEDLLKRSSPSVRKLIVTDTVFSVDGDLAPLREIVQLKERFGAILMIDEAHGGGIFGKNRRGVAEMLGVEEHVEVHMGTFSKAFGSYGAYVCGTRKLVDYLLNKSRSFIYSTSLPPAVLGANLAATRVVMKMPELSARVLENAAYLRQNLIGLGFDILASGSQIIPVVVGDNNTAVKCAASLQEKGLMTVAIRPPTVPPNTARLRLSVTAEHKKEDMDFAVSCLGETGRALGII